MKKHINQQRMRERNTAEVFTLIRNTGRLTRREIEALTDMSWGAVSTITAELIEEGYIKETKATSEGVGRIPSYLEVEESRHFFLGMEINGTGLSAVLINLKNEIMASYRKEVRLTDKEALLFDVLTFTDELLAATCGKHLLALGVAMEGPVNSENGIALKIPGRLPDWENVPIAALLEEHTGLPTFVFRSPDCILFAATHVGNSRDTLLIRADRGIGMAAMLDNRILNKPGIFELAHITVVPDGLHCNCGKFGCLDQYASIPGLEKRSDLPFPILCAAAEQGNAAALRLFSEAAKHLAFAIVNTASLLQIDRILLCGQLWEQKHLLFDILCREAAALDPTHPLQFDFTGPENAPLGAATLAARKVLKAIRITKNSSKEAITS